jgi:hypothetical protein
MIDQVLLLICLLTNHKTIFQRPIFYKVTIDRVFLFEHIYLEIII